MAGQLDGKVVVITGGASGIGLGTVELFIAEGASVVVADMQDEKGAILEQRFPGKLRYVHCDVMEEADIAKAVNTSTDGVQRPRHIVQQRRGGRRRQRSRRHDHRGLGWGDEPAPALGDPWHETRRPADEGARRRVRSSTPPRSPAFEAGWGPIAYSTAKGAVIHLTKVAAMQLAVDKIRVNAICPGLIATSIFGAAVGLPREVADQMAARIAGSAHKMQPIAKAGMPDDIARACLYLASDASVFVTGVHLPVDGGITVGGHAWDPTAHVANPGDHGLLGRGGWCSCRPVSAPKEGLIEQVRRPTGRR